MRQKIFFFIFFLLIVDCACLPARQGLWASFLYAGSLNKAESLYLQESYSESINECAANIARNGEPDKAYFLLGLNYLKIKDAEKAREKLQILMDKSPGSPYLEAAKLAYADSYFIDQDYSAASRLYEEIVKANSKMQSTAYFRLAQCALKTGQWEAANNYSDALRQKYPLSLEAASAAELLKENEFFFTVQVGCFANLVNAQRLLKKLKHSGYDAYIDQLDSSKGVLYRVRAGKLKSSQEALALKSQLDKEGYPSRIFP